MVAHRIDRGGDPEEVLDELQHEVFVRRVVLRDRDGELEHVLAEHRHPCGAIGLFEASAGRQLRAAVEDADVVEAEEPTFEEVPALRILAVHPPLEVQHEARERLFEELDVDGVGLELDAVEEERRERVHRRVHVAEVPLVGGHLAARMQVQLRQHDAQLALREVGVDHRQRDAVEGEIPRRVPGVLPLVRHRDDVLVDHVEPRLVPACPGGSATAAGATAAPSARRRGRSSRSASTRASRRAPGASPTSRLHRPRVA